MDGTEFGFVFGCVLLAGGIIAFFSLRQFVCGLIAWVGFVLAPYLAFAGLNLDFKREGGVIAGIIVLASMPLGFIVTWVAAHLLLPKTLLKNVTKKTRRIIGVAIGCVAVVIIVACV